MRDRSLFWLVVFITSTILFFAIAGIVSDEKATCRLLLRDAHSTADSIAIVKTRSTCASVLP